MATHKKKTGKRKHHSQSKGHYCRVCGEYKANEKFSGKGHASHICKACHALPLEKRNEMENINKIDRISENFFISKENLKRLKSYANDKRYPESSSYAQNALDSFYSRMDEYHGNIPKSKVPTDPVVFSELNDALKKEIRERLEEMIDELLAYTEYLPDDDDMNEILTALCDEISESLNQWEPEPYNPSELYGQFPFDHNKSFDENIQAFHEHMQELEDDYDPYADPEPEPEKPQKELVINDELRNIYNGIMNKFLEELKADGLELISFMDSLNVAVTERLKIRKFITGDLINLHRIMKKPEVMYAWEKGFHKHEVKTWINKQLTRYKKDGYGYFAVTLKDTGKIIGQAGFFKSEINGGEVIELGYIFDNSVWGKGYCTEAVKACVELAFKQFKISKIYCTVRPENEASVKVAERIGMVLEGEYIKVYEEKEMPHLIFALENK